MGRGKDSQDRSRRPEFHLGSYSHVHSFRIERQSEVFRFALSRVSPVPINQIRSLIDCRIKIKESSFETNIFERHRRTKRK